MSKERDKYVMAHMMKKNIERQSEILYSPIWYTRWLVVCALSAAFYNYPIYIYGVFCLIDIGFIIYTKHCFYALNEIPRYAIVAEEVLLLIWHGLQLVFFIDHSFDQLGNFNLPDMIVWVISFIILCCLIGCLVIEGFLIYSAYNAEDETGDLGENLDSEEVKENLDILAAEESQLSKKLKNYVHRESLKGILKNRKKVTFAEDEDIDDAGGLDKRMKEIMELSNEDDNMMDMMVKGRKGGNGSIIGSVAGGASEKKSQLSKNFSMKEFEEVDANDQDEVKINSVSKSGKKSVSFIMSQKFSMKSRISSTNTEKKNSEKGSDKNSKKSGEKGSKNSNIKSSLKSSLKSSSKKSSSKKSFHKKKSMNKRYFEQKLAAGDNTALQWANQMNLDDDDDFDIDDGVGK